VNLVSSSQNSLSKIKAPEFPRNLPWFNSPPLSLKDLKGKVVLIDFWTYSCINCQRTIPYLKEWWDKYKDNGLVIIGVHDPEFEFEKDPKNLQEAINKYGVSWPVVADNNYQIWNLYNTHAWPTKHLVDHNGIIIYSHVGEGNYLETESQIQEALQKAGFKINTRLTQQLSEEQARLGQTPELYCGYLRGVLGNEEGYQKEQNYFYQGEKYEDRLEANLIYLHGVWRAEPEYLEHPRKTASLKEWFKLSFRAKKVYLVMESSSKKPLKLYVNLDEAGLDKKNAGSDIKFDKNDQAFIEVTFSTIYNLISSPTSGDHILKLSTKEPGLRLFAFTFGS